MTTLHCSRCNGRVFIDQAYSSNGHVEFFCLKCGKRWEAHRDSSTAQFFTKMERRRELGHFGWNASREVLPQ